MSVNEIAKRAGVSKSTVSLVINNKSSIPPATAERVRRAMRDLNYTPAPAGTRQGRPAKSTGRIGVVADMPTAWLHSQVYTDALHGVEAAARQHGCSVVLVHSSKAEDQMRLYGAVDGIVLFGHRKPRETLGELGHLPCVTLLGDPSLTWCDRVMPDDRAIGALAAEYLLSRSYQYVAMLTRGPGEVWWGRHAAFRGAIESAGGDVLALDVEESVKIQGDEQYADRAILGRSIDAMLAAAPRPSGLFLPADMFAPTVYFLLLERGIRPGIDIEIVTCNNEQSLLNALSPRPASIDIHVRDIGQIAVDRLMWRINNLAAPRAAILIQPDLVLPERP